MADSPASAADSTADADPSTPDPTAPAAGSSASTAEVPRNPLTDHFGDLMAVLPRISQFSKTLDRGELVDRALADTGVALDRPSMSVLSSLSMAGEPLRDGEIARRMNVSGPQVTRLVHDLERRRLARRVSDPEDGRARLVELTEAGSDAATAYVRSILGAIGGALTDWSADDLRTLGTLLSRLIDDLNAYARRDVEGPAAPDDDRPR